MTDPVDDEEFLKQRLAADPSEEFLDAIATTVVEEMSESFPELSRKSRPIEMVLQEFREKKLDTVDSTAQYKRKLDYLETYLDDAAGVETTDDLTSEDVEQYDTWRKYESLSREEPLSDVTLRDDMYLFREFIQYLIEHRMAPSRFEKSVTIPEINYETGDGVDEKQLDPAIAKAALEYLRKYEYADVEHVTMDLLIQSGPRKNGLRGRDVDDFDNDKEILTYEHEPDTPLKNDEKSEREITLYGDVAGIIQDYLTDKRPDETDDEGRQPLLTKGNGRISKSTLQKIAYKWTRPCVLGLPCPHDRDPEDCEAAQQNNAAFKCPSSRAPQHIRTGYITDQKNHGVSADAVAQRCDVSPAVQALHYDFPDETADRERYEDEFRNADPDDDSGFTHE